ncbi:hypothetical protein P153DRAFT_57303 [Dothidotthia symphoricarpi CBS 119687]|uniref:Extracellular membrane protein CFEM domain-containing protein n=1 Tax=Dothidotthia symphoricarpi CBS 119687 TaxID=1392245 RepID=A0A6A6A7K3_9PLEO|nr:uncharacterized protein P153DRAFT_57303 [Dothidotthia symphoricarpi CBS 119687]KAF2127054.1 hypothetical protein P153DRAFT_57303 [Dothidotthia symphoricarpi CBS 119687]
MRYATAIAVVLSVATTFVAAQSSCAAQTILDACIDGYQSRIASCQRNGNDYICLCDVYRDVLVCYNNCPDSTDKPSVQNTVTSYCLAADPLRSASLSSLASAKSVAATATTNKPASTSASPAGAALVAFLGAARLL